MPGGTLIVGTSHAGVHCAAALREGGYSRAITLIGDDCALPYNRPPLSKGFLSGDIESETLLLRSESFYTQSDINLILGRRACAIDRATHTLLLDDGRRLSYETLVLATGTHHRPWPTADMPEHVHRLKTLSEAKKLLQAVHSIPGPVVVIGGGYIGLEIASTLRTKYAREVHVIESAPRLLMRAASPELAAFITQRHKRADTHIHTGIQVSTLNATAGALSSITLSDGTVIEAGLAVIGIGVLPNQAIAQAAGLECQDGIVVDSYCRTTDKNIFAIGDCARFPYERTRTHIRLECVQNAHDQARMAAAAINGAPQAYQAVPWFWSDQLGMKFQTAGLVQPDMRCVPYGTPLEGKGAFFLFDTTDTLAAVETINAPALHMTARRLLALKTAPTLQQVTAPDFDPKEFLSRHSH